MSEQGKGDDRLVVTVYRGNWLRGIDPDLEPGKTLLLDREGNRCCLGFGLRSEGAEDHALRNRETPAGTPFFSRLIKPACGYGPPTNTAWARRAMEINDNVEINDAEREAQLERHCENSDSPYVFVFVDGSEP